MAYCAKCGNEKGFLHDKCEKCGFEPAVNRSPKVVDDGGFLWGLLGFCVPIAGLVLYLIWKHDRPNTAKAVGIGALVYLGFYVIIMILYIIIFIPCLFNNGGIY